MPSPSSIGYVEDHPSDNSTLEWRASLYLKIRKVPEAVADLTKAADAGESAAQNQLGVLYMTGVPGFMNPDAEKGVEPAAPSCSTG